MTARDDYRAAEARLAACEEEIEALRTWERDYAAWERQVHDSPKPKRPPGDLQSLLLQRERLQEESYRAYRRVVGEGG